MMRSRFGPYETLQEIGRGGMGVVYRARHTGTGDMVALKVARTSGGTLASIRTEIAALLRIQHPNVVRILDHGVESGAPWYAMEHLEGRTWLDLNREIWPRTKVATETTLDLANGDPTEPAAADAALPDAAPAPTPAPRPRAANGRLDEVLRLALRLCAPLAALHGRGVVHRDLKPANVFLRADGEPILVDLGLAARFPRRGRERLEVAGLVAGTARYMAPEQARGLHVDARADLHALGAMLYETITGRVPFSGSTIPARLTAVANDAPVPPSQRVDGVPEALDALVLALLAKDPRERMGYADDVAAALARIAGVAAPPADAAAAYLYRPRVAGRDEVLALLLAKVAAARGGAGGLVALGGASGVGKTVLAAEVGRLAARASLTVVTGECVPTRAAEHTLLGTAGAPLHPLRPLLQLIADTCRAEGAPACDRVVGPRGGVLAAYEPAFSSLPGARRWPEPFALPDELARTRVIEALTVTIEAYVAAYGPLLVLLDDLQGADDLTLGFLGALSGEWLASRGFLVVGTYRREEVGEGLADLLARPTVERSSLDRLPPDAVAAMVSDMLALREPPVRFVEFLYARSEGNPSFVAQCLRVAVQEGVLARSAGRWTISDDARDGLHVEALRELGRKLPGGPGALRTGRWERVVADAAMDPGAHARGRAYAEAALAACATPFPGTPGALLRSFAVQGAWLLLQRFAPRVGAPDDSEVRRVRQASLGVFARALGLTGASGLTTLLEAVGRAWCPGARAMCERLGDPTIHACCDIRVAASSLIAADWDACDRLVERGRAVAVLARDERRVE